MQVEKASYQKHIGAILDEKLCFKQEELFNILVLSKISIALHSAFLIKHNVY